MSWLLHARGFVDRDRAAVQPVTFLTNGPAAFLTHSAGPLWQGSCRFLSNRTIGGEEAVAT